MSSTSRNDNAIVIDVTSQLSGIILSIPKRGWLPSAPQSLAPMIGWLRGRDADTTTELEGLDELMASVQQQFDKANNEELNRILEKLSVFSPGNDDDDEEEEHTNLICLAFRRIRDRWPRQARSDLLTYFSEKRVNDLSARSKAIILDAMQQPSISSHPGLEQHIRRIIVATTAMDLIHLKLECDAKGNYHSLHKLIYRDVSSESERNTILKHLKSEAVNFKRDELHRKNQCDRLRWLKVISDVDDTFKCSAGHYPAGCDYSLPKSCLYPGITALYRELDLASTQSMMPMVPEKVTVKNRGGEVEVKGGAADSMNSTDRSSSPASTHRNNLGNLVFLSARPRSYHDWSERGLYRRFSACVEDGSLHCMPTALLGDLKTGARFVGGGTSATRHLSVKKAKCFREFSKLWPECRHVFVGDNGQGDVRAAEIMSSLGFGNNHPFFSPPFEADDIPTVNSTTSSQLPAKLLKGNSKLSPNSPHSALASYLSQQQCLSPTPATSSSYTTKSGCLQVAYINKITPIPNNVGRKDIGEKGEKGDLVNWRKYHIIFVNTYIDAAIHAATHSYCCRSRIHYEGCFASSSSLDKRKVLWCPTCRPSTPLTLRSNDMVKNGNNLKNENEKKFEENKSRNQINEASIDPPHISTPHHDNMTDDDDEEEQHHCVLSFHGPMISFSALKRVCQDAVNDFLKLDDQTDRRGWRKGFNGSAILSCYARELYRLKLCSSIHMATKVFREAGLTSMSSNTLFTNSVASLSSSSSKSSILTDQNDGCGDYEVTLPKSLPLFSKGTRVAIRRPTQVQHFLNNGSKSHMVPPVFGSGRGGAGEFGCDGVITGFRSEDGIYEVDLIRWRLAHGKYAKGYFLLDQLAPISSDMSSEGNDKSKGTLTQGLYPHRGDPISPRGEMRKGGHVGGASENEVQRGEDGGIRPRVGANINTKQRKQRASDVPHGWGNPRFGFFRGDGEGNNHKSMRRMLRSKLKAALRGSLSSSSDLQSNYQHEEEEDDVISEALSYESEEETRNSEAGYHFHFDANTEPLMTVDPDEF